ncbi:MAG: Gfo/Idh/MocA family oxidoreductase [Candidatus Glassbacteria bacterium]
MQTINWGLIGCGDIAAKRVAPALRDLPGHEIRAVARKDASRVQEFAGKFGAQMAYESAEQVFADPEVEAVYLATPVDLHLPHTLAAARAGKHVLCEKPMALNPAECDRMIEACDKAGVLLGVAYYRRFYPAVIEIKALIGRGAIGKPVLARALACEYWTFPEDHPFRWRLTRKHGGGGPLMDFGSHRIDILLDILGPVAEVAAFTDRLHFEREVEDSALVAMRHTSGAQSFVGAYHTIGPPADELEVFATEGKVVLESLNSGRMQITEKDRTRTLDWPPHTNLHLPLIEDFGEAIRTGREPRVSGRTGRLTSVVLEAAYRASREGITVKIE